ncbi:hypothetical protein LTR15_007960 [Elasticomyces elasticus]|nr:hypothetical protein LTR15_007960 [Elasticomyces elasticus]
MSDAEIGHRTSPIRRLTFTRSISSQPGGFAREDQTDVETLGRRPSESADVTGAGIFEDLELQPLTGLSSETVNASIPVHAKTHQWYHSRHQLRWLASIKRTLVVQCRQWRQTSRFSGWRFGVLTGFAITVLVLLSNLALLLLGIFRYGGYKGGVGELATGSSSSISAVNAAFHLVLNVLSTLLLGASNYSMQVLTAPSRTEVDHAHHKGYSLDIGVLSFRNLRHIGRRRFWLWSVLAASSIPLHLFYNSAIFQVTTGNEYTVTLVSSQDTAELTRLEFTSIKEANKPRNQPATTRMSNADWRKAYDETYVSLYSDLYLIGDQLALSLDDYNDVLAKNTTWSCGWPNTTIVSPAMYINIVDALKPIDSGSWMWVNPASSTGRDTNCSLHIGYAYAIEAGEHNSALNISLLFMAIVLLFNVVKAIAMLLLLLEHDDTYLVTCGDAVSSFLAHPDPGMAGYCTARKEESSLVRSIKVRYLTEDYITTQMAQEAGGYSWRPRKVRWGSAISTKRRMTFTFISGISLLGCSLFLGLSRPSLDSWAASSSTYFSNSDFSNAHLLLNAWLANIPQLLLSAVYLSLNSIYTSIALAQEWNRMAAARKGLRVTAPQGEQRSTFFLQLPYRWGLPLMVVSGTMHWLLSQTVFLVNLQVRNRDGSIDPDNSTSACGFSALALLVLTAVGWGVCIATGALSLLPLQENLPAAGSSSAVFSAACQPPRGDFNAHLKPVQWGATARSPGDVGHCTITSQPITKPIAGQIYA